MSSLSHTASQPCLMGPETSSLSLCKLNLRMRCCAVQCSAFVSCMWPIQPAAVMRVSGNST